MSLSPDRPELADVGRLARRLVRRTLAAARADEGSLGKLLAAHLGAQGTTLPVARGSWPAYDQVNVQTAIDIWLAEPGRTHELVGLTEYRHRDFGLADLLQTGGWGHGIGIGSVETQAMPAGPDGETRQCVQCAITTSRPIRAAPPAACSMPQGQRAWQQRGGRAGRLHRARTVRSWRSTRSGGSTWSTTRLPPAAWSSSADEGLRGHRGGALLSFVARPRGCQGAGGAARGCA